MVSEGPKLSREKYMSRNEVNKLREAVRSKAIEDLQAGRETWVRNWVVLDFALHTGLRVQELSDVQLKDLDLNIKEPTVFVIGKGRKSGTVYFDPKLIKHLQEYLDWRRKSLGEQLTPESYFFASKRGGKFATRSLQTIFKRCLEEAGLPVHYSIHACRHTFGTYLYEKTKDLRLVQKQLRHSSLSSTQIYADVTPENMVNGVNGLWE